MIGSLRSASSPWDSRGEFEAEWSSLVNPHRPVTAQFVHGISDDDVATAPSFSSLLPEVAALLEERAVVAHNAAFDVGFLNASFSRAGFPVAIPAAAAVCTMELSKIYLPAGRHSLVAAAERAGVVLEHHHRALADAWTAAGVAARVPGLRGCREALLRASGLPPRRGDGASLLDRGATGRDESQLAQGSSRPSIMASNWASSPFIHSFGLNLQSTLSPNQSLARVPVDKPCSPFFSSVA